MIVNKFISVKSVIEDLYRDMQLSTPVPFEDCVYWCYEALELLNQPLQYVRKVTGTESDPNLEVTDYKAELPCDFHKLEQIAVNGMPARYSGNTFHHLLSGSCCGQNSTSTTDIFVDNLGNQFTPQQGNLTGGTTNDVVTFDINDNYITLSVREGSICMAYLAYPVDADGFPMIPDDITYKVALKKYLQQKLRYIDWASDPSNSGKRALFQYDEREWFWYAGKTTNKMKMPHPEQMESLKNQLVRLIPKINEHDSFFKTLGAKQLKRIH